MLAFFGNRLKAVAPALSDNGLQIMQQQGAKGDMHHPVMRGTVSCVSNPQNRTFRVCAHVQQLFERGSVGKARSAPGSFSESKCLACAPKTETVCLMCSENRHSVLDVAEVC